MPGERTPLEVIELRFHSAQLCPESGIGIEAELDSLLAGEPRPDHVINNVLSGGAWRLRILWK